MGRLSLYYIKEPEPDRWLPGDRKLRPLVRRLIRGKPVQGGLDKVLTNLRLGLDRLGIPYEINLPFDKLLPDDNVGVLGRGRRCLDGYARSNTILAGIGLMNHPSEWPDLCKEHPIGKYLQHSSWANEIYKPYFGDRCDVWPVGIDTEEWLPSASCSKTIDFLIYDKILWNYDRNCDELLEPIRRLLRRKGLTFEEIRYGSYHASDYHSALARCRAMIFLCEHESQGLAYQECLSTNVPILAWEQGWYLDPNRFRWGISEAPATSVPYWDERCGEKFISVKEFPEKLQVFLDKQAREEFTPRSYVLENLTLGKCAQDFVRLCEQVSSQVQRD